MSSSSVLRHRQEMGLVRRRICTYTTRVNHALRARVRGQNGATGTCNSPPRSKFHVPWKKTCQYFSFDIPPKLLYAPDVNTIRHACNHFPGSFSSETSSKKMARKSNQTFNLSCPRSNLDYSLWSMEVRPFNSLNSNKGFWAILSCAVVLYFKLANRNHPFTGSI